MELWLLVIQIMESTKEQGNVFKDYIFVLWTEYLVLYTDYRIVKSKSRQILSFILQFIS